MPISNLWDYMQAWSYVFIEQNLKSWLLKGWYLHLNTALTSARQNRIQSHLSNSMFGFKLYRQKYHTLLSAYLQSKNFAKNIITTCMEQKQVALWSKWWEMLSLCWQLLHSTQSDSLYYYHIIKFCIRNYYFTHHT